LIANGAPSVSAHLAGVTFEFCACPASAPGELATLKAATSKNKETDLRAFMPTTPALAAPNSNNDLFVVLTFRLGHLYCSMVRNRAMTFF
jgi:hypothetical protein